MTINSEILDLMNAELDGVAGERDRARLREILASDEAATEEFRRLVAVRDLLATVLPVEPPRHLSAGVMRAVGAHRAASRRGIAQRLRAFWPGEGIALRYAYAVAAGAAIGIVGLNLITGGGPLAPEIADRDASATLASPAGRETAHLELAANGLRGSASVRRRDRRLAVEVDVTAATPVELSLRYDPRSVEFLGLSSRTGGIERIQVVDGTVRWSQAGPQRVTVLLAPRSFAASQMDVGFSGEGGITGGGTVELPGTN
jgi:hypothetical protein